MRFLLAAVFIAFAAPVLTSAQALNPEITSDAIHISTDGGEAKSP